MSPSGERPEAYARAREAARRELARTPLGAIEDGAGAELREGRIYLEMLDGRFSVGYPEGDVRGEAAVQRENRPEDHPGEVAARDAAGEGGAVGLAEELLALHYLTRSAGPLDFADVVRFPGLPGAAAYADAFVARSEHPLAVAFAERGGRVVEALDRIGARADTEGQTEGLWTIAFFRYLPLGLRLGAATEGLPAAATILFPRRAGYLQHVEDLAVAGELFAARVLELAGAPPDEILYTDRA